jgi:hypothetical protein
MSTPLIPLQRLADCLQHPPHPDDPAAYEKASFMHKQSIAAIEGITAAFDACLVEGVSEQTIRKYVIACQEKITALANEIPFNWLEVETTSPDPEDDDWRFLCNDICHQLEDLILYLMFTYAKHYDKLAVIPVIYRELMRQRIEPGLSVIRIWFSETDDSCKALQDMILGLYDAFDPRAENKMSYYQLDFLRALQQALLKRWAKKGNIPDHHQLQQLLFQYNFNSTDYYNYCTSYISQQLSEQPDMRTQLDLLSFIHKSLNLIPVQQDLAYSQDAPSIRELLKEWIQVESKYLRSRLKHPSPENAKKFKTLPENFKLQSSLTLSELAALFRIFIEMGVIQNRNMQDVFRLLALCVSVENKEAFDANLFQSNYYNIPEGAYKKMEDLAHMIVRKTFQLRKDQ